MAKKENNRFANWVKPKMKHGKFTKYNWIVLYPGGLELGEGSDIGALTLINARFGVAIGAGVEIGSHCSLYSHSTIDGKGGKVTIRRNAKIGSHSLVMPGVTIGENAVIGAFSFVNKDIPANSVAYGVPAKVVNRVAAKK